MLGASFKAHRIPQRHGTRQARKARQEQAGWIAGGRTGAGGLRCRAERRGVSRCCGYTNRVWGLNTTRGRNITLATPVPSPIPVSIPVLSRCRRRRPPPSLGAPVWRKRCLWRPQAASPVELSATTALSQPRLRAKGFSAG